MDELPPCRERQTLRRLVLRDGSTLTYSSLAPGAAEAPRRIRRMAILAVSSAPGSPPLVDEVRLEAQPTSGAQLLSHPKSVVMAVWSVRTRSGDASPAPRLSEIRQEPSPGGNQTSEPGFPEKAKEIGVSPIIFRGEL